MRLRDVKEKRSFQPVNFGTANDLAVTEGFSGLDAKELRVYLPVGHIR